MLMADAPRRVMLTTDAVGGVWRYCLELAQGFVTQGASVLLVSMGPAPGVGQRAEAAALPQVQLIETDLPLDWLADHPSALHAAADRLAQLAKETNADTVQLHTPALVGQTRWPCAVIAMAHSCVGTWWKAVRGSMPLPPDLAWRADAVKRGMARADAVLAPSDAFASALRDVYGDIGDIVAITNGRHTRPLPRRPRARALTAGRLWDEGKNVALLDTVAGATGWPIGAAGPVRGPNGARLHTQHLQLLGNLDAAALAREYAGAAVFVSVARYEPFGLAVLEAAQAGTALVLSDIPSFRELWDGAAMFVPPDDTAILAQCLDTLLRQPEHCAALGAAAQQHARRYSVERMVTATWSVHCNQWRAATIARARHAA